MGKGSSPRNNHSKEWFANYDDIDWSANPKIMGLTDAQTDAYYLAVEELKSRGIKITRFDEDQLIEAVKHDIKK